MSTHPRTDIAFIIDFDSASHEHESGGFPFLHGEVGAKTGAKEVVCIDSSDEISGFKERLEDSLSKGLNVLIVFRALKILEATAHLITEARSQNADVGVRCMVFSADPQSEVKRCRKAYQGDLPYIHSSYGGGTCMQLKRLRQYLGG